MSDDSEDSEGICEVTITAPSEQWLIEFTQQLVSSRLAACGHHSNIRSIYTWTGEIHDQLESRVSLHTRSTLVPAIIEATRHQHPYEVPCVISLPITQANSDYQAWILAATKPDA